MTRRLAREEGLLVGGSSGMAVSPRSSWPSRPARRVIVVLLPDSGRGYLQRCSTTVDLILGFLRTRLDGSARGVDPLGSILEE